MSKQNFYAGIPLIIKMSYNSCFHNSTILIWNDCSIGTSVVLTRFIFANMVYKVFFERFIDMEISVCLTFVYHLILFT